MDGWMDGWMAGWMDGGKAIMASKGDLFKSKSNPLNPLCKFTMYLLKFVIFSYLFTWFITGCHRS